MNTMEKAKKYADKYIGNHEISQADLKEAYIQGSKDMYIEKEHETINDANEYLPPAASEYRTTEVIDCETGELVYYDYDQKAWFTCVGDFTSVERWRFGEPVKVKYEKTAHQLQEELKQAQFEIEEMKNTIKELNRFRFSGNDKFDQLADVFEELLNDQFTICELRDFWRKRAGLTQKCEE